MQVFCSECGDRFSSDAADCPEHEAPLYPVGEGDDFAGQILNYKFLLLKRLGDGRFGIVYEARHLKARARLAVKLLRDDSLNEEVIRKGFLKEAQATINLVSEHVVCVRDIDEDPHGRLFIVMDLVEGGTLGEWVDRTYGLRGRVDPATAIRCARQICIALRDAHARGIVHRDLKPDNILVEQGEDTEPILKVVDFSTAWRTAPSSGDTTELLNMIVGTPAYMSPEQCMGTGVDARSDLYALGIVLYELLSGQRPIDAPTSQGYLVAHVTHPPHPLARVAPDLVLPEGLNDLIMRMLEKDQDQRPPTAEAVIDALDAIDLSKLAKPIAQKLTGNEQTLVGKRVPATTAPIVPAKEATAATWGWGIAAVAAAAIAVGVAVWPTDETPERAPETATETVTKAAPEPAVVSEAPRPAAARPAPPMAMRPRALRRGAANESRVLRSPMMLAFKAPQPEPMVRAKPAAVPAKPVAVTAKPAPVAKPARPVVAKPPVLAPVKPAAPAEKPAAAPPSAEKPVPKPKSTEDELNELTPKTNPKPAGAQGAFDELDQL